MFNTARKNAFKKIVKQKQKIVILIILYYNIKSEIMTKLSIYHLFATAFFLNWF